MFVAIKLKNVYEKCKRVFEEIELCSINAADNLLQHLFTAHFKKNRRVIMIRRLLKNSRTSIKYFF